MGVVDLDDVSSCSKMTVSPSEQSSSQDNSVFLVGVLNCLLDVVNLSVDLVKMLQFMGNLLRDLNHMRFLLDNSNSLSLLVKSLGGLLAAFLVSVDLSVQFVDDVFQDLLLVGSAFLGFSVNLLNDLSQGGVLFGATASLLSGVNLDSHGLDFLVGVKIGSLDLDSNLVGLSQDLLGFVSHDSLNLLRFLGSGSLDLLSKSLQSVSV